MMTTRTLLHLDTETYSTLNLPTVGTHQYAENCEIIMWQWAVNNGEVQVSEKLTDELKEMLNDENIEVIIHNSAFDRNVIRHCTGIDIPVNRIFDTMACALAHSLPGSLGDLCEMFNLPQDKAKDKEGKKLINLFCKLQPPKKDKSAWRASPDTHPEEWKAFCNYGKLDVIAMREIYKLLPRWNFKGKERKLWELDQKINDRGICMDLELAHAAIRATDRAKKEFTEQALELTDGEVVSVNKRKILMEYILAEYGIQLTDLTAPRLAKLIAADYISDEMKELLNIRLEINKVSVTKYKRVLKTVSSDGRLRGTQQFCGASRTGRFAGRYFQPHNLPRPSIGWERLEEHISELKANAEGL